ncbi:MAG: hypothetical protein V4689_05460 [Verrucomicrobiota bacterium]
MPHQFHTTDGTDWKPGRPFPLQLADGSMVEGIWAGCAQHEKLGWWLKKPGNQLARSSEVSAIAIKGEDDGELRWGETPDAVCLFFVIEPPTMGKSGESYRLAKMVTIAATPEQVAFFQDERFALLGKWDANREISIIPPLTPPPAPPAQRQGELF